MRELLQQAVTAAVPEAVVDLLEPVEIDEKNRQRRVRSGGSDERLLEPIVEQRAIGESGQPIVESNTMISRLT